MSQRRPGGASRPASRLTRPRLQLTGEFRLEVGVRRVELSHSAERVLAYLALTRRPVARSRIAGELWPDVGESRAAGDLRSALWRLRERGPAAVRATQGRLEVAPELEVDVVDLASAMESLLGAASAFDPGGLARIAAASEILPDWDDGEWLAVERVRYGRLRLDALEAASRVHLSRAEWGLAVQAATAAVDADPFRESAHRILIDAYLQDGNAPLAIRAYRGYRDLLVGELGVEPSTDLRNRIDEAQAALRP